MPAYDETDPAGLATAYDAWWEMVDAMPHAAILDAISDVDPTWGSVDVFVHVGPLAPMPRVVADRVVFQADFPVAGEPCEPCSVCGGATEFARGTGAAWHLCAACEGGAEAMRRGYTH